MPSTILSDNGVSSGTAGIKTTGSNDGILGLQTTTAGGTATTAVTIDTSQNVGIGTTSPNIGNANAENAILTLKGKASTRAGIFEMGNFGTTANDQTIGWNRYFDGSTENANIEVARASSTSTAYMKFSTNGGSGVTERMRIDSSGNLLVGITSARANAGDVQVSKGISFPATQSAQSDVNTLDDYEEGTWTPVLGGSTSESGQTYSRQLGQYTKIGRQVTVTWDVIITTVGTMVGSGHLKGLPFTVNSTNQGYRAGLALGEFSGLASNVSILSGLAVEGTTELYIRVSTSATATGVASITATSLWGNGTQFIGTITYFV